MDKKASPLLFAICINDNTHGEDLRLHTVYRVIPDPKSEEHGYVRIIDDSGEDYIYPASYFVVVTLPVQAADALVATMPAF